MSAPFQPQPSRTQRLQSCVAYLGRQLALLEQDHPASADPVATTRRKAALDRIATELHLKHGATVRINTPLPSIEAFGLLTSGGTDAGDLFRRWLAHAQRDLDAAARKPGKAA